MHAQTAKLPTIPPYRTSSFLRAALVASLCIGACSAANAAAPETIGPGLGFAIRTEHSPYRDAGTRNDLVPLYVYESRRFFIEPYRAGLKLAETPDTRLDATVGYRFEGFPHDRLPASLAGMAKRNSSTDIGLSYQARNAWGSLFAEVLHDVGGGAGGGSHGTEARFSFRTDWSSGRLTLFPQISLAARNASLNNYYYGVRASEATATRPAYQPGAGINTEVELALLYRLSDRWRINAGISARRWSAGVRASPIVEDRIQYAARLGLAYDFSPERNAWPDGRPLIVKLLHGKESPCDLAKVLLLKCFSTDTINQTRISAIEVGRPFIEGLHDWPLDFIGYLGLLRHDERGLQANAWQVNAQMKAFYYGFPWSQRVRTRLGLGAGVSYANRVPFTEARDQAARGRSSSKLLLYLDPSIDVSVGDLIGVKRMHETYLGIGVSHRSGIFGTARTFGNVNGGSNYIYSYVEWRI